MTKFQPYQDKIALLQDDYTTVSAVFVGEIDLDDLQDAEAPKGFRYTFKAERALGLAAGDLAVVHARDSLSFVRIVGVDAQPKIDPDAGFVYKWIVDKVDVAPFLARKAQEEALGELLADLANSEARQELQASLQKACDQDASFADKWRDQITKLFG